MNIIHIVPGLDDPTCGIAVAAKMVARRQIASGKSVECVDFKAWTQRQIVAADEVWVHSMWTPGVMRAAWTALRLKKPLVRMPHGCMDPVKWRHRWWKKMWVAPIERWLFEKADRVVATCDDEVKWIKDFEPKVRKVEILSLGDGFSDKPLETVHNPLRLLFVGRLHPLKGMEFLLEAMKDFLTQRQYAPATKLSGCLNEVNPKGRKVPRDAEGEEEYGYSRVENIDSVDDRRSSELKLRVIGKDEGEGEKLKQMVKDYGLNAEFCGVVGEDEKEKAWDWCDVLVLPTLSENFGLVVAEALERGKRVITTDGAPVWGEESDGVEEWVSGGVESRYGGRLLYLKGYRDGTDSKRVELLKKAIHLCLND